MNPINYKNRKSLREYTYEELEKAIDNNETTELSELIGICSEILRRMINGFYICNEYKNEENSHKSLNSLMKISQDILSGMERSKQEMIKAGVWKDDITMEEWSKWVGSH